MDELADLIRADLDKVQSEPLPTTNSERLALLKAHLKTSLERAKVTPDARVDAARLQNADGAPDMDQIWPLVKRTVKSLCDATQASSFPTTDDFSPCGVAVMQGVGLITVGCAISGAAGIGGFGVGVYLLTQNCHEGSTFLE